MKARSMRNLPFLVAGFLAAVLILVAPGCGGDEPSDVPTEPGGTAEPDDSSGTADLSASFTDGVKEALVKAKEENRVVMVELHDPGCDTCNDMDRAVFSKQVVKDAMADVIHVRITPGDTAMIEAFGIVYIPSFIFLKPTGEFMADMLEGYRPSRRLAGEIENFKLIAQGKPPVDLGVENHPKFGKG